MGKIYIQIGSESYQRPIGCVQQCVCGEVIHRSEPFALEDAPQGLSNIHMRTIWREKEDEQASLLPDWMKLLHKSASVYAGIVKHQECISADTHRQPVKKVCDSISCHVLRSGESFVMVMTVNHAEDIESEASFRRNIYIFSTELPAIRHIAFSADMALFGAGEDRNFANNLVVRGNGVKFALAILWAVCQKWVV